MADRRGAMVLFLLVWFSCAWFGSWEWNANSATRLFAAISLVEDGDATIDPFAELTIDKARFGDHVYMDKAPGMTLMALPAVAVANVWSGETSQARPKVFGTESLGRFLRIRTRLAAVSGPAVLTAIAAALLYDLVLALGFARGAAVFASLGYALGTPIWGWSTTLFGHAAVAALYVIAVWAGWRATQPSMRLWPAAIAGAALGWAVVVEYQAVLAGSVVGAWIAWRWWQGGRDPRQVVAFLAGGIAAGVPLIAYNLIAFGTVFRIGYAGVVGWEGMSQGLFGLGWPSLRALFGITFGAQHGLVWVAPVLLIAPIGLAQMVGDRATRGVGWMAIGVAGVGLLVNAAFVYWEGGNSTGPRLAMPIVGVLAIGLAPLWAAAGRSARIASATLLAVSIAINAAIAAAEVLAPPGPRFPVWTSVIDGPFRQGALRTVASEWFGFTPWQGFALWAVVALPLLGWLARHAAKGGLAQRTPRRLTPRADDPIDPGRRHPRHPATR